MIPLDSSTLEWAHSAATADNCLYRDRRFELAVDLLVVLIDYGGDGRAMPSGSGAGLVPAIASSLRSSRERTHGDLEYTVASRKCEACACDDHEGLWRLASDTFAEP